MMSDSNKMKKTSNDCYHYSDWSCKHKDILKRPSGFHVTNAKPQKRGIHIHQSWYLKPQGHSASSLAEGPKDPASPRTLVFFSVSYYGTKKAQMSSPMHSELSGVELNPNSTHWVPPMYRIPRGKWEVQEKEGRVPVL